MVFKVYFLWIKYDVNVVIVWYCKCKLGVWVVGVFVYIVFIFCYLGYVRYNLDIRFGVKYWGIYLKDVSDML